MQVAGRRSAGRSWLVHGSWVGRSLVLGRVLWYNASLPAVWLLGTCMGLRRPGIGSWCIAPSLSTWILYTLVSFLLSFLPSIWIICFNASRHLGIFSLCKDDMLS